MTVPVPPSPLDQHLGIVLEEVSEDCVRGRVDLDPGRHHQPYGIVHGGLYCTIVETLASMGAVQSALSRGLTAVGLENHTSFVRMASTGTLLAEATPLQRGSQVHLWQVTIRDQHGHLVAQGTCRLLLIARRT